jgi:hypothetical protein
MMTRKPVLVAMTLSVFAVSLPRSVFADGERVTQAEMQGYAQRESQAPGLDQFKGGGCIDLPWWAVPLIILSLPVALPIYGIFKLGELVTHLGPSHPKGEPAPKRALEPDPSGPGRPSPSAIPLALGSSR